MSIILPCDLATWSLVTSYLDVLGSGLDSMQDVIIAMLQVHNLCNVAILNDNDARSHDEHIFDCLREVVESQFSNEDKERFLKKTLPCIAKCAAALPLVKPSNFSYILAGLPKRIQFDRRFIASLVANAFMSTLPLKAKELMPFGLPDVTFATLFPDLNSDLCSALRFKGFLEYFDILEDEGPCGKISYELVTKPIKDLQTTMDIAKKPLAPVFIVEEEIRPMDLSANVDILIVKDMNSLCDMNLQHPELVPLLLIAEPTLKENEWIQVKGLMARAYNAISESKRDSEDACVCILERTNQLTQDKMSIAQGACLSILETCYQNQSQNCPYYALSVSGRSRTASFSSKLPSSFTPSVSEQSSCPESEKKPRAKRQCFAERLQQALERGCTPDEASSHGRDPSMANASSVKMTRKRRYLSEENPMPPNANGSDVFGSDADEESSFSEDSAYSFESLILPYDMEAEYEEIQANLIKPLHQDELCRLRSHAITEELKRMCLSDAYLDKCLHMDITTTPMKMLQRFTKSDIDRPFCAHKQRSEQPKETEGSSKLPVWIISSSSEIDSKRFLVEWLSASLHDIPLVVYQSSNESLSTDVIAAICSWIEEQSWTTVELSHALAQGAKSTNLL